MKALAALFMAVLALQTPAPPETMAMVEGTVTLWGSSDAIPKVQVTIRTRIGTAFQASALTDSAGHFTITGVPPGVYDISGQRGGYANPTRNGERILGSSLKTIAVAARQHIENANLTLVRGGVVTGRVVDANGKPIARLHVEAVSTGKDGTTIARKTVDTNDRGEYRLFDLDPGKYVVSAEFRSLSSAPVPGSQESWVKTYFPGVTATAKAIAMEVEGGSAVTGDFTIQSSAKFIISGIVVPRRVDATGLTLSGIYLVPVDADETSWERQIPPLMVNTAPQISAEYNMRFEIRTAPGSYELFVWTRDSRNGAGGLVGRTLVQVNQQDIKDIAVPVGGVTLNGRVLVNGRDPGTIASLRVQLVPRDLPSILGTSISPRPTVFDSAGAFTIPDVPRGKWGLYISNVPAALVVADIRQGNIPISRNDIQITDEAAEPIQIVFSPAGTVEGYVRDADQRPVGGMRVAEYPDGQPPAVESHETTTDAAGHFLLSGLAPGNHTLFAIDPVLLPGVGAYATLDQPSLAPYQSQGIIAKVNSGGQTSVVLSPIHQVAPLPQ